MWWPMSLRLGDESIYSVSIPYTDAAVDGTSNQRLVKDLQNFAANIEGSELPH